MTWLFWLLTLALGFIAGAVIEALLCQHRRDAVAWKAYASARERDRLRWRSAAGHWYREYGKATRTSEGHASVLAALGRAVSEGGKVDDG